MLLHPATVAFGTLTLDAVVAVTIDRLAAREAVEFSDAGPHVAFADIPEQRTLITITRRLDRPDLTALRPGDQADLSLTAAVGASDAARARLTAPCVALSVRHHLSAAGPRPTALQTITLIAVSTDGAADPITLTQL